MATIAVPLDMEEGHTLPQFALLRQLKARGHRVCCLGAADIEDLIREQGFEFLPIIDLQGPELSRRIWQGSGLCLSPLVHGVLDPVMDRLKPDVVLVRSQYYTEGLVIHYRYRAPVVFFISSFRRLSRAQACENIITKALMNFSDGVPELLEMLTRAGAYFKNFKEVAQLALSFPELMLLPEAFDLPGRAEEPGVYYMGAGVDLARAEGRFEWEELDPEPPLIYCALGSQNHLQAETSRRFLQVVIDAAAARPQWQFVVAIGKSFDIGEFTPAPSNVRLSKWVPQLEVLSRTDVMLNHGGYGTIKECVLMAVPMIVFPLLRGRDHVLCAERVIHHGLGLGGDIEQITPDDLSSLIEHVIKDRSFKERVTLMREKFMQQDRLEIGVKVIEEAISASGQQAGRGMA